MTKCPIDMQINDKKSFIQSLNPLDNQKVFFSTLSYSQKIKSDVDQRNIDTLAESDFILVTGIADSSYLVKFLKSKSFNFKHLEYSDHYNFNKPSIDRIRSLSSGKKILTSEKDFGRLKPKISDRDIYYIEVSIQFNSEVNDLNFDETISEYINQN